MAGRLAGHRRVRAYARARHTIYQAARHVAQTAGRTTAEMEESMTTAPPRTDSFAWLLAILRDIAIIVFVIVYVIHTV